MSPVPGVRLFLKYFAMLRAQTRQTCPAQVLNFHEYRIVHSFGFLSVAVNHSHMNAPRGAKGKSNIKPGKYLALRRQPE
jgi:hypothetical protein